MYKKERARPWAVLAAACVAQFVFALDMAVMNVALPAIRTALGFAPVDLSWVVHVYALAFGGFLLLGGRACDLYGRRRMFVLGLAVFGLCSPAVRTRETLDLLAVRPPAGTAFEPKIYDNDPGLLLSLVAEAPDDAGTVLLVGHNPAVHQFVHDLTGAAPDRFPTCALAVVDLPGVWADVRPGLGTLVTFRSPKD